MTAWFKVTSRTRSASLLPQATHWGKPDVTSLSHGEAHVALGALLHQNRAFCPQQGQSWEAAPGNADPAPGLYLLRNPGQNLPAKLLQVLPHTWRWPHSRHMMAGASKFGEIVTWQEVTERLQAPIPVLPPLSGSLKTHLHCAWSFPPVFLAVPPKPSPTCQGPTGVGRQGPLPSGML